MASSNTSNITHITTQDVTVGNVSQWKNLSSFEEFCGKSSFWDAELLNYPYPKFTPCFNEVALKWIPCLVYIGVCIPYLFWLRNRGPVPVAWSVISVSKTVCTVSLLLITIATIIVRATDEDQESIPQALYVSEILKAVCFLVCLYVSHVERHRGVVASIANWIFWLVLLIFSIVPFYTYLEEDVLHTDRFGFIMCYIYFALVFISFIIASFAEYRTQEYMDVSEANTSYPSPEQRASVQSLISYWWITSLVVLGFKKSLEEDDVFELIPSDKCETLMPSFIKAWQKEARRTRIYNSKVVVSETNVNRPKREEKTGGLDGPTNSPFRSVSALKTLILDHGLLIFTACTMKIFFDVFKFVAPLITEALMEYIRNRENYYKWRGFVLAVAFFMVNLISTTGSNVATFLLRRVGMRIRTVLINAVYRKSLTVASIGDETSRGEVVNLMSVDAERVQQHAEFAHNLFTAPFQICLALYLLYRQLGVAMLAGMAVLALMFPMTALAGHFFNFYQGSVMRLKDKRISLLSEILSGIKVLKLYAWEGLFQEKLQWIRLREIGFMQKFYRWEALSLYSFIALPSMVQLTAFGVCIAVDGYLDPTVAFVSLQIFQMLNDTLAVVSLVIPYTVQCMESVRRINVYLNKPDIKSDAIDLDCNAENAVTIENGDFTWSVERPVPTLQNINLEIEPCSLVAVVGTVGSGKSSLLSAMLGEMERIRGKVTVKSSMAYVPQQAWIQNASIEDNILFGGNCQKKKYDRVIEACALRADLEMLPGGDKTEIGEKGINISGGQKQRVSLARAVYSDRDIYLMDDPLSAVDSHVGKHIFTHVIGREGLLKHKTRVLVTHGVQWLPMVDKIFVMSDGVVSETGTYEELLEEGGDFAVFLKEYAQDNSDNCKDDEETDHVLKDEVIQPHSPLMEGMNLQASSSAISFYDKSEDRVSLRQRQCSTSSHSSGGPPSLVRRLSSRLDESKTEDLKLKSGTRLIEEETGAVGKVKLQVYLYYLKEIGLAASALIVILYMLFVGVTVFSDIWLTRWTSDNFLLNTSHKDTEEYQDRTNLYLGVYGGASIGQGLVFCFTALLIANKVITANKFLHKKMLVNVLRSPMSFFDTTPMGRIQNRFSGDINITDDVLPINLRTTLILISQTLVIVINISYATPIFLTAVIPLSLLYIALQVLYIPTIRQLQRIISVTRSPIHAHFSETLGGITSIRAYQCQDRFIKESMEKIDHYVKFFCPAIAANSWISFCLQMICNLVIFAAAFFAVLSTDISPSLAGLSLAYSTSLATILLRLVLRMSEVETNLVSMERIKEYTVSPQEAPWVLEHRPPSSWPETGTIMFDQYQTRYRPGLDLVLQGVTCTIRGGEKVGVVGRTGAGKSSMTVALFRIIESAGGRIVIDGEDVSHMGLHDLRNKITILPQDPVIFSGSLRMNLDPFDKYAEPELWNALDHSNMKEFVQQLPEGLDYECGEEGSNLSVGQRQLLCLARTLLRKTKILVLDEATAAVDMETDDLIQRTIRSEFSDCTIFTIAHRLNTIMDYDRVMVLDKGTIQEFDTPSALLADQEGVFYGMAKDAGLV